MAKFPVIVCNNRYVGLAAALDLIVWRGIVVHPLFYRLPVYTQLAILAHEEGHLILGHVRRRFWWALTGLWWRDPDLLSALLIDQEYEADAYCAGLGLSEFLIDLLLKSKDQANKVRPSSQDRIARLRDKGHEYQRCFSTRR